jgi:hypothetical protein
MHTLEKLLSASELRMRCHEVVLNGDRGSLITEPWAAKHYRCELYASEGERRLTMILGTDDGPPEVVDVLDAAAAEAAVVEETGCYEDWALQMGFDPDSRRGERIYRAQCRQAKVLYALLGEEAYRKLLWETERL